jgi:hypothetical protein
MNMRSAVVAAAVLVVGASWTGQSAIVLAQDGAQPCTNESPDRPTALRAVRNSANEVRVEWTPAATGCAATKYYVEASASASTVIEADTDDTSLLLAVPRSANALWRVAVRAFNEVGLSPGRSVALDERATGTPAENPCPAGSIFPPTLISAQVTGRRLEVQWSPDSRCLATHFVIAGSLTPDGPTLGTVTVDSPSARSWTGEVPSGSYYVRVLTHFYGIASAPSAAMLVHVP